MENKVIINPQYDETFINILIVEVNWLLVYWNITEEYDKKFKEKYGEDFLEKTKIVLIVKNLSNNTEEKIDLKEPTNNYYAKFNYSDSIYQVELARVGIEDEEDYGYKLISNEIHSPNIKILINDFNKEKVKFMNINTYEEKSETEYYKHNFEKEDVEKLYNDTMRPYWNEYKSQNGYKEK